MTKFADTIATVRRASRGAGGPILTLALSASMAMAASQNPCLTTPWAADFSSVKNDPAWILTCDASNQTTLARGALEFRACANTHAHVEHALGSNLIRISCALKSDALSTPALLSLRWDDSNHLEFGMNSPVPGRLGVREVLGTYPHDFDAGVAPDVRWQCVAIELASDCIRYLASQDGKRYAIVHVSRRPDRFASAPKVFGVGQDAGGKIFPRPTPWLGGPSGKPMGNCWMRELRVEALEKSKWLASSGEQRQLLEAGFDRIGEQEIASPNDPSFDSVSRHFPTLKWSREIVGVKDHPVDIGIAPDGSLQLSDKIADHNKPVAFFRMGDYRFGSGGVACSKTLLNGWMPIVIAKDSHEGLELEETVFGWSKDFSPEQELLGYVQFRVTNSIAAPRQANLELVFTSSSPSSAPLKWQFDLPAQGSKTISVCVPYKILETPPREITAAEFQSKLADTSAYWNKIIACGSRFEIPETRVQNAYRTWLAYNFLNVAKRQGVLNVCDGSGFYGEVYGYSAALFCNGLDLMGYPDMAETYCDALLTFQQPNGLFAVNSGDTDTGALLWTMAEHYHLTGDMPWLRRVAPKMGQMCQWIVNQRHAALTNSVKESPATRGLIRYQPYADLLHPAADYFSNGYLWKGLNATARVFAEAGLSAQAAQLRSEADDYIKDLQASMKKAVFKDRGERILPMIPDTRELWKESDGSADGYYGIIAPCLLETGMLAAHDWKAKLVVAALQKRGGLVAGISQFHQMADHAYTYGYWLNCLQRDDVKRAICGLYGSLAFGMSRSTYSAVECTEIQTGENYWMLPHTYSNTQQLRLLRNLLVREEGRTLWLGQAIPRPWLAPGNRVAVNAAPTTFGPVSYSIEAGLDGSLHIELSPPIRDQPAEILLRLREPGQRPIARIHSVGATKIKFSGETLRLAKAGSPVKLDVWF